MGSRKGTLYKLGVSLFKRLTGSYPDRFRRQFAGEICEVLQHRLEDASALGGAATTAFIFQESGALIGSLLREHWHARWGRKETKMVGEELLIHEINSIFMKRRLKRAGKVFLLLAALIPLYYTCIYAYAFLQIAQLKQHAAFPTLEDAVYSVPEAEFRGARVVRIDLNHSEPCYPDGKLPFIWCVTSTVFYDRIPSGYRHSSFNGMSSYYHLREGWVPGPELFISEFIGGIVERLGMQAVGD